VTGMLAASLPSLKREALLSVNSAYGQTSSRSDASTVSEAAIVSGFSSLPAARTAISTASASWRVNRPLKS